MLAPWLVVGVCAIVAIVLLVWAVASYNYLVRARTAVANAWAQIDVQLKRRHDLIPNLVETVKGYASHESSTIEAVTAARAAAISATTPGDRVAAEQQLGGAMRGLIAVAENYPGLKASANFEDLQQQLAVTEDRIAYSRQYYNDAVGSYNAAISTLPRALSAAPTGFRPREFFTARRVAGSASGRTWPPTGPSPSSRHPPSPSTGVISPIVPADNSKHGIGTDSTPRPCLDPQPPVPS
jgi:LemA protein